MVRWKSVVRTVRDQRREMPDNKWPRVLIYQAGDEQQDVHCRQRDDAPGDHFQLFLERPGEIPDKRDGEQHDVQIIGAKYGERVYKLVHSEVVIIFYYSPRLSASRPGKTTSN